MYKKRQHEHRTIFLKNVHEPADNMIKSAKYNKKLGKTYDKVQIKKWKGASMMALTLEERKSCTPNCAVYDVCFGNNMPFAKRYDHTHPDFLPSLRRSIHAVAGKGKPIVLRLHVLGDFFSRGYVDFWHEILDTYPNINAFGYTHHAHDDNDIGSSISKLNALFPERFAVRHSGDMNTKFRTRVIKDGESVLPGEIICPEELGKTTGCTTCGICWSSQKPVVFLEH